MKISLIIVSSILTLSVFVPFFLFIINGTHNTSNTKKHINYLLKDNGVVYSAKEIWRKNFLGISNDKKILTYLNSNQTKSIIKNINLEDIKQCNILKSYHKDRDKIVRLKSSSLELVFKSSAKQNITIPFFNIDDDLSEDYEIERIEKWHKLIFDIITKQSNIKLAS
ncbi:hypothetical protein L3X39_03530 [Sabulilitoribacter multivorans]|uniref:Uncharacterized protein n=1 Tax=Flaviramulus multivorans TaxID=1304750 RepID=A0ABS9IG22_9FLAO|nr:hypothetical protein [Flaviramulus multivorans]MCF7559696.1 hypothetical protein [Flaviramulus multivorans]